jgi:hypothetical protein
VDKDAGSPPKSLWAAARLARDRANAPEAASGLQPVLSTSAFAASREVISSLTHLPFA